MEKNEIIGYELFVNDWKSFKARTIRDYVVDIENMWFYNTYEHKQIKIVFYKSYVKDIDF